MKSELASGYLLLVTGIWLIIHTDDSYLTSNQKPAASSQ